VARGLWVGTPTYL